MSSKSIPSTPERKAGTSQKRSINQEIDGSNCISWFSVEFLSKRKRVMSPKKEETATSSWQKRRESILKTLNTLTGTTPTSTPKRSEEKLKPKPKPKPKPDSINRQELEMNLQLMKGELPRVYCELLKRFSMADLFLENNYPRLTRITDLDHYLTLSQCKMSFEERHVEHIVYFYGLNETDEKKVHPYHLGRTKPRIVTEKSILLLKLIHNDTSLQDSVQLFQGSSRNLNDIFVDMQAKRKPHNLLKDRKEQLRKHLNEYIDKKYEDYLERTGMKRPASGRASSFTMSELGEMPVGEIPPPIIFHQKTARESLAEFEKDVAKAVDEHRLSPLSPVKSKKFNTHLDIDLDSL